MLRRRRRPDSEFERLVSDLSRESSKKRIAAAYLLAQYGDAAVEPLCAALKDPDRSVLSAAASSLGEIGDPRAAPPLIDALRDTFAWRRPWFQIVAGFGLLGVAVVGEALVWLVGLLILVCCVGLTAVAIRNLEFSWLGGLWEGGLKLMAKVRSWFKIGDFFGFRRRQNAYCLTIAEALMKIAENSPSPQLREALPDLGAVAGDFVQQDSRTRDRAREVSARIAALTEKLQNLPAPAMAPPVDTSSLPRATAPVIDESQLPRAVVQDECA